MANLDTNLESYLATLTGLPVQQGTIDEDKTQPFVWFQRQTDNQDTFLNGTPSLTDTTYTIEVSGLDIDAVQSVADTIKGMNGFHGTMAGGTVLGVFVADASDDYIYRNMDTDVGNFVCAFQLRIIH